MKKKVLILGVCIAGLFLCACEMPDTPQTPMTTSTPKVLLVDAATPTPTLTLEEGEIMDKTEDKVPTKAPVLTPEETATPVPTEKPVPTPTMAPAATATPTPTLPPPTATPEPTLVEKRPYEKGELSFGEFRSEWMGMKFVAEEGVEFSSREELDETMRLIEEVATGKELNGALDYEKLGLVYEMSLVWPDKGLTMQMTVERMTDASATETDYVEAMKEDLGMQEESIFTYVVDDITYQEIIAGKEFENFGYTIYYDESTSLHQENYIRKLDDRIILISIMGESETDMQELLNQFEAY